MCVCVVAALMLVSLIRLFSFFFSCVCCIAKMSPCGFDSRFNIYFINFKCLCLVCNFCMFDELLPFTKKKKTEVSICLCLCVQLYTCMVCV